MGTLGYMSPEQVKGKAADQRSDLFSFGAILYEMLSGRRAFHRDSAAETMSAILREEPPDLSATNQSVPARASSGSCATVSRRIRRSGSTRRATSRSTSRRSRAFPAATAPVVARRRGRRAGRPGRFSPAAVARDRGRLRRDRLARRPQGRRPSAAVFPPAHVPPRSDLLGALRSRRTDVMYSAAWDGKPMEIFVGRPESPESRPFGLVGRRSPRRSRSRETWPCPSTARSGGGFRRTGTLAQLSVAGGAAPRDILKEIEWADWGPDGKSLAIVRVVPGRMRIEYPIGKVLYETSAWVSHLRVSPRGDQVAFIDHPTPGDDGGSVAVRGPRRQEEDSVQAVRVRPGPRVVSRRIGGLVHGDGDRWQSRASTRRARGKSVFASASPAT